MVSVTNKILTFKLHVLVEVKFGFLSYWDSLSKTPILEKRYNNSAAMY